MRLKVKERTQVNHKGRVYGPGEEFDAPEDAAGSWLKAGIVSEVKARAKPKAKPRRRSRGESAGRDYQLLR